MPQENDSMREAREREERLKEEVRDRTGQTPNNVRKKTKTN